MAWSPIFLIGVLFFVLGAFSEPTGNLTDMFIRLSLVVGKMFFAVYLGEVFWNLFFPTLDFSVLDDIKNIDPKHFHMVYGRLIMHGIMQFAVINV